MGYLPISIFRLASLQEDFLKSISWLQELKLRGSWGIAGNNANIPQANAVNTYGYGFGSTGYPIDGSNNSVNTGYTLTGIGNPLTTWEKDKILNIGVDASLFNHLDLTVEWYKKTITGLLFQLQLPSTVGGATAPYVNVGDVQNTGRDIAATYHDNIGQDFKFSVGANITAYKNKITKLEPGQQFFDVLGGSRIGSFVREQIGQPIGEFYGYKVNRHLSKCIAGGQPCQAIPVQRQVLTSTRMLTVTERSMRMINFIW